MRVRPEQLERHLGRGLASVYVVHGDEPLQREESLDAIRAATRAAGFAERIVLHAESGFDWGELQTHAASLSLFAERRLIDLRLPDGSPGRDGGPVLAQYAANPPPDMVLLLSCRRLDRRATSTKWFKALDGAGDVVEVFPMSARDLPRWIVDRGAARGVAFERDAAAALAERSEGNLLACAQEIDKLRLLCEGRPVTVDDIMGTVADSARFGAFDLIDPALEGDGARSVRILRVLREEGFEPIHVLGSLTWAVRGGGGVGGSPARRGGGGVGADPRPRLADLGDSRGVRHRGRSGERYPPRRRAARRIRRMVEAKAPRPARAVPHAPPGLGPAARNRRGRRPDAEGRAGAFRGHGPLDPRRRVGGPRTPRADDVPGETAPGRAL